MEHKPNLWLPADVLFAGTSTKMENGGIGLYIFGSKLGWCLDEEEAFTAAKRHFDIYLKRVSATVILKAACDCMKVIDLTHRELLNDYRLPIFLKHHEGARLFRRFRWSGRDYDEKLDYKILYEQPS